MTIAGRTLGYTRAGRIPIRKLRAFVAAGLYDSLNSCSANAYLLTRLAPADAARITARCYEGGHMMYEDHDARLALARDIRQFYAGSTAR